MIVARWFWPTLVVLALVIAANHLEYHLRPRPDPGPGPVVRAEAGPDGHTTIALRESTEDSALTFARLGAWDFKPGRPAPADLQGLNGQMVTITGFMYPLGPGDQLSTFCLLRSTQTCCYGPRPQFTQYLLVETTAPVALERLAPVTVHGRFQLDPQPAQGYVYRLEAATVSAHATHPVDPEIWARDHGRDRWRWAILDQPGLVAEPPVLPPDLAALEGRRMVVDGAVHHRQETTLLVAATAPGQGPVPGLRQALTIHLAEGQTPTEAPFGAWEGLLRITADPGQWPDLGVVRLEDARPLPTQIAAMDDRRLIPPEVEILLVVILILTGVQRRPAALLLLLVPGWGMAQDVLLAEVGARRITLAQVQQGLPKDLFGPLRQEARTRRLDRLIRQAKAATVFTDLGQDPRPDAVEAAYRTFLARPMPLACGCHTVTTYAEYLTMSALTDAEVREELRWELAESAELERSWQAAHPGEAGAQALLATHGPALRASTIRLWLIPFYAGHEESLPPDPNAPCWTRALAARQRLDAGIPFSTVAQEAGCFHAEDQPAGDAGLVPRDDPLTAGAASGTPPAVPPDTLSPPLPTDFGVVLLRWRELTDAEVLSHRRATADWERRLALRNLMEAVPVHWTAEGQKVLGKPRP